MCVVIIPDQNTKVMKKIALITLALFCMGSASVKAQSQDKTPSYISVGPVAEFGHSWVSSVPNTKFQPSVALGARILYSRFEHWGFGGTVSASQEGYTADVYQNGMTYTNTINPVYLRVTPSAYYFFGDYGDRVRPKVFLGPSIGFKVDEKQDINEPGPIETTSRMPRGADVFETVDFGFKTGAGVNIQMAPRTWLNLDANYYHGLLDATMMGDQNRRVRANVGVLFGI